MTAATSPGQRELDLDAAKAREKRLDEEAFWSALGASGALLIVMIAWDATRDGWVKLTPDGVPQYFPPSWRLAIRGVALAIAAWVFLTAWRDVRVAEAEAQADESDPRAAAVAPRSEGSDDREAGTS